MENASVQRGLFLTFRLFSLIRHALRRATFPVGEGDLRRGRGQGRGDLKIQLCRQISVDVVADGFFLQDSDFSYLGSFRNPSP